MTISPARPLINPLTRPTPFATLDAVKASPQLANVEFRVGSRSGITAARPIRGGQQC